MAIIRPEDMDFSNKNIIMIIYGLPGVGKTTLALSAPSPVLIDTDRGVVRVHPAHRKDTVFADKYEDILADTKQFKGVYETVIIDTGGSLVDFLKDWAMRTEPSANKKSGGFSQQGFGFVKSEFWRLSNELRKDFNVIYLFHAAKDKQNDEVIYDLICEGSAKTLVWQPADLGAYMHIINGERYLGFTPTMNYTAKSAYGIKGLVKVPELSDGEPNDFLTRLFAQVKANIAAETSALKPMREAYERAMKAGQALIEGINAPEDAIPALNQIRALEHALTSQKELEAAFKVKIKELGYTYDTKVKAYVAKSE
jgi:hypothetical protein